MICRNSSQSINLWQLEGWSSSSPLIDLMARYRSGFYYYYCYFDLGTQFPGNEKIMLYVIIIILLGTSNLPSWQTA